MDLRWKTQVERIVEGFAICLAGYILGMILTSILGGFPISGYVFIPTDAIGWVKLIATYWILGWTAFIVVEKVNVRGGLF